MCPCGAHCEIRTIDIERIILKIDRNLIKSHFARLVTQHKNFNDVACGKCCAIAVTCVCPGYRGAVGCCCHRIFARVQKLTAYIYLNTWNCGVGQGGNIKLQWTPIIGKLELLSCTAWNHCGLPAQFTLIDQSILVFSNKTQTDIFGISYAVYSIVKSVSV